MNSALGSCTRFLLLDLADFVGKGISGRDNQGKGGLNGDWVGLNSTSRVLEVSS